ncbi:MAG: hypothetical protein CMJ74_13640 [Planctomycetaceae bacterium]|nr:hypothetical protein [Planctomycetaceae bacterium]|tara:strand:+ start:833 stop:2386 length:1554 start_codon:yes stop_codon:yes gene_type:complete
MGADVPTPGGETDRLVVEQTRVVDQYERFKKNIIDLADFLRETDPERAEVLEKAVAQMNQGDALERFNQVVALLGQDAILISDVDEILSNQSAVEIELQSLLTLLLTENRQSQNQSEKQKLTRFVKEIGRMIRIQKGIQAETERMDRIETLVPRQGKLAQRADSLAKKMQQSDEQSKVTLPPQRSSRAGSEPDREKQADKESPNAERDGSAGDKQSDNKQAKNNESGKQGKQSSEEESSQSGSQAERSPQKALERARKQMRSAIEDLQEAKKDKAKDKQFAAVAALEQAKAELEKILRQLREEEIERVLALLEARFRKVLRLQKRVYEDTIALDQTPATTRDRSFEMDSTRLSEKQSKIVGLIDATLVLFRNDGSAVALPEASMQLREDMELVMVRLDRADTGPLTQQIMEDIIEAIEEIIGAIEKSQQDQAQRKEADASNQSQSANSTPPLVDMLAELKMIRSLQWRVNRRTARYQEVLLTGRSSRVDLLPELKKLADRQGRIEKISRDIVLENNR